MSRQPVRDAIKLLERESIVVSVPGDGFALATYTPEESLDLMRLHGIIELEIGELAAVRRTNLQSLRLLAICDQSRAIAGQIEREPQPLAFVRPTMRDFHHTLYEMTQSPDLREIAEASHLRIELIFYRIEDLASREDRERHIRDLVGSHIRLAEAIEARNPTQARACCIDHAGRRYDFLRTCYLNAGLSTEPPP